jgi:hypothetical protein
MVVVPIDWNVLVGHSSLLSLLVRACVRSAVARIQTSEEARNVIDVTGVKVFSATKAKERELLGEVITDWIRSHHDFEIVDKIVTQSSDSEFHCLTITLFYKHKA